MLNFGSYIGRILGSFHELNSEIFSEIYWLLIWFSIESSSLMKRELGSLLDKNAFDFNAMSWKWEPVLEIWSGKERAIQEHEIVYILLQSWEQRQKTINCDEEVMIQEGRNTKLVGLSCSSKR